MNLKESLFENKVGYCVVSIWHLYRAYFEKFEDEARGPYADAKGGIAQKQSLLVANDSYNLKNRFRIQGPYYYLPFDMNSLFEIYAGMNPSGSSADSAAPEKAWVKNLKSGFSCNQDAAAMQSSAVRLLGIGVEFLGISPAVQNFGSNEKVYLDRSDSMSWYNQNGYRYSKTIDYSSLQTEDRLASLPWTKSLPALNSISPFKGGGNPCANSPIDMECMKRRLGSNPAAGSMLDRGGFAFQRTEFNTLLGNKYALVIRDPSAMEAFEESSNVLVHFYWYNSVPLLSVK